MASSDNLMTMEPWGFRSTFNDAWFQDMFVKETETLTKVLQKSFSNPETEMIMPTLTTSFQTPSAASGPTVSGGSTENETAVSKRRSNNACGVSKKIVKRKTRASKRASTTYITADVDSFRQMVQQVTGVRMGGNGHVTVASILKPEPRRPVDRVQQVSCLPTLDTSAFLLDPTSSFMAQPPAGTLSAAHSPSAVIVDGSSGVFGFNSFSGFPTLESGM
ncbi:calmodulin-binding protein 25-like [Nicotiana tomentosiformis]|uniref:calmodulin-binding protein 25-like n=1 Tax=Nicotiana tomentosiformis TaxID=4098 RepID=UPI00051AC12A|nr:calmodulin-binding protein 25-like [Nicotiana tomentosiformis]